MTPEAAPDLPKMLSLRDHCLPSWIFMIMVAVGVVTRLARIGCLEIHEVVSALLVGRSDLVLQLLDVLVDIVQLLENAIVGMVA